jgi:hypothetical protein
MMLLRLSYGTYGKLYDNYRDFYINYFKIHWIILLKTHSIGGWYGE